MRSVYMALAPVILLPAPAFAQVSGEVGVYSQYLDDDLLPLTPRPVVQAGVYVEVNNNCSLDVWANKGIDTREGDELDVGASCRFNIGQDTEVEVIAYRDILRGQDDITEMSARVTHGPVDVTVLYFAWDKNPDALRITAGYTVKATDKLSLRPAVVYQSGFGERDILGGGLYATYRLTNEFEVVGKAIVPFKGDRNPQVSVGLKYSL